MKRDFTKMSHEEKCDYLREVSGKDVCMIYDYSDLPDGHIGPQSINGKITARGVSKFTFDPDDRPDVTLSIDGIISIETR